MHISIFFCLHPISFRFLSLIITQPCFFVTPFTLRYMVDDLYIRHKQRTYHAPVTLCVRNVMRQLKNTVQCVHNARVSSQYYNDLHTVWPRPRKEKFITRADFIMKNEKRRIFVESGQRPNCLICHENVDQCDKIIKGLTFPIIIEQSIMQHVTKMLGKCRLRNFRQ